MPADTEEDALAWAGDEQHEPAPVRAPRVADGGQQLPALLLVTYGILGGIHLIYLAGWVVALQRLNDLSGPSSDALGEVMSQFGEALAIISPVAWFAAAFMLTRGRRPVVRLLWLVAGIVVVAPWPYVLGAWTA